MQGKIEGSIVERVIKLRRHFHQYPELGMEEYNTAQLVAQILKELNLEVREGIAKTGVIGFLQGGRPGKTVLLRADMDALPIQDQKNVPYASKITNCMHACGHDAHTAILLGVAMVLSKKRAELPGNVKFVFQPAEETVGGAKQMIEEGVIDVFSRADYALALHMDSSIPTGEIAISRGLSNAASDMISLEITGEGTHGAYPHKGIDVIVMAGQFLANVQSIISRNVDPTETAVLTFGSIKAGEAGNVIPDSVKLKGILRTLRKEVRDQVLNNLRNHLQGLITMHGGSFQLDVVEGYPSLINNPDIAGLVIEIAKEILGEDKVHIVKKPSMGVEDFAYFLQKLPGVMWYLGCRNEEKGVIYPGHNPKFDIDEDALEIGIRIQTEAVLRLLN